MQSVCKVSVIIPVYNAEKTIEETAKSVLNQTYSDIELIMIDDGSKDNSLKICENLVHSDSRAICFSQENSGPSAARNKGIENAKGEWVIFVDADDILPSKAVENYLTQIKDDVDVILGCSTKSTDFKQEILGVNILDNKLFVNATIFPRKYAPIVQSNIKTLSSGVSIGATCGKIIRRSFLMEHNIRYPVGMSHHEDTMFCLQIFLNTQKVVLIETDVYYYRPVAGSLSKRFNPNKFDNMLFVIKKTLEFYGKYDTQIDESIEYFAFSRAIDCVKGNISHVDNTYSFKENKSKLKKLLNDNALKAIFNKYDDKFFIKNNYLTHAEKLILLLEKHNALNLLMLLGRTVAFIKKIKG